jgi:TolB-like protein/DNA-binding winged helix-turn-helix (wHTH) protein
VGTKQSFGPFVLDPEGRALNRDGTRVVVGQRGLALLRALLDADGQPVSKGVLLERGWPGTIVEEVNLSVQIAALRKALGTTSDGEAWITTVPRVGYRLLQRPAPGVVAGAKSLPTVAVLPFHNLSGDAEQEYFADGIVDDLIAALSRFRSVVVVARSSSFAYKGRSVDLRQIAKELGASYLLEGSVRRSSGKLRIVVQLADGASGAGLWAETFDGILDDLFKFQDRITRSVAGVVEPHIQQAELDRSRRERAGSIAAYDLYLRGAANIYFYTAEANADAVRLLERAIEIEPTNGLYLCFAAWALEHRITVGWPPVGGDDKARSVDLAHRAVQLAGDDARVLARCGLILQSMGREYERGLLIVDRAVELNPNDAPVLVDGGVAHLLGGDLGQAERLLRRAIEIQPNNAYDAMGVLANVLSSLNRFEEALAWAAKAIAINSKYVPSHWIMVSANVHLGRMDEARDALEKLLDLSPGLTVRKIAVVIPKDARRDFMMHEGLRLAGLPVE